MSVATTDTTPAAAANTPPPKVAKMEERKKDVCCAEFDPTLWAEKEFKFENKPFVKETTWCIWCMPLNFGGAMNRALAKIEGMDGTEPNFLMLADMKSPWSTRIYISVDDMAKIKDSPEVETFTGTFVTKVFEGPYKDFPKWIQEMKTYVKNTKGLDVDGCDMYAQYGTCPKCAKKFGKNYVVLWVKV